MNLNAFIKMSASFRFLLPLGIVFLLLSCCNKETSGPPDPPPGPDTLGLVKVYMTKGDKSKLLNREGDLPILETGSVNWPVITIDTTARFQSMEGFGAALTGSSAYLLDEKMNASQRTEILRDLFDTADGIGISYLRLTIGASDFSLSDFSYDDVPAGQTDFNLEHFTLEKDLEDVIPVLKEILQISPSIKLMGSPWSPPAWMKTSGSMKGGKLRTDCYSVYADYFVRYIQGMAQEGIHIASVTPQNEPLYFTAGYPCMEMQPAEQAAFIKGYLGPKFESAGITTQIIIYDHNYDNANYAITVLNDPDAKKYITGSAFHAYGGDVSGMSTVHYAHQDKGLYFTEISGGGWATDFSDNLMWFTKNIFIGTAINWSKNALLWNLVLDQSYGPTNNGCSNCRGVVTLNTANQTITKNEEYYAIAHFSKFVRPGAERISAPLPVELNGVSGIALQNPDGSKAMILCNDGSGFQTFTVNDNQKYFSYTVPPQSVATLIW